MKYVGSQTSITDPTASKASESEASEESDDDAPNREPRRVSFDTNVSKYTQASYPESVATKDTEQEEEEEDDEEEEEMNSEFGYVLTQRATPSAAKAPVSVPALSFAPAPATVSFAVIHFLLIQLSRTTPNPPTSHKK